METTREMDLSELNDVLGGAVNPGDPPPEDSEYVEGRVASQLPTWYRRTGSGTSTMYAV